MTPDDGESTRPRGRRRGMRKGDRGRLIGMAVLLTALSLVAPVAADEIPDPVDPTAVLSIDKSASATEVGPGDTLVYTLQVGCSAISDVGCRDAITTDVVPEPFVIESVVASGPNAAADPVVDGQSVRVDWTEDIGAGSIGMLDNTTSQVQITVQVPEDVSYDDNGATVTNQAVAEATNAVDAGDSATVTLNVPLDLATSAAKTFAPDSALAAPGTPVTASLTGTNDANATVDTLVIQDPIDPQATPNPFTYLGFTGFGTVTPPEGATSTTYEVYVADGWVVVPDGELPPDVDAEDVQGGRVTFTGEIPAGATGSVDLALATTDEAADVTADTTVDNTVRSEVTVDGQSAAGTAADDFLIQAVDIEVGAAKAFSPDLVVAGQPSTVTVDADNRSPFAIDTLTITEPSTGSFSPEYSFDGFADGIDYPAGATSGEVVYQPSGERVAFADGETPAPPTGGADTVTSFEIVFDGAIEPGGQTSIPFTVTTDPDLAELPAVVTNEVAVDGAVDGATAGATASDDLFIYDEVIETYVDKTIRPAQIIANPGEIVTVTLRGGTTERPDPPGTTTGTTGNADRIVIQDPVGEPPPIEGDPWWNAFDLETIAQTPIPADSALTVEYYDTATDTWETLVGPVTGPTIFTYDVPEDISEVAGGVRFVYDYTGDGGGFAPGTDLEPNVTSSLRDTGRYDGAQPPYVTDPDEPNTFIPNCAQASASSPTPGVPDASTTMPPESCPELEILPLDGEGVGELIDKDYGTSSSGGDATVIARSGDTVPSTLTWSTGGYSGFETVEITDAADPTIALEDSVYDAFDLVRVQPITPETDPDMIYDQVTRVQLWDGTEWTDASNDPCPEACDGVFPGMVLTEAEQESTQSVRLTFAESPTRAETIEGDLDAPPVGSGVARSIGNEREVTLTWQVRDTHRSDGSPALGADLYNDGQGTVRNTVDVTGFPAEGDSVADEASDVVTIIDVPITTTTDKTWRGGPLAVPSPNTPADQYPLSEMTVTTTNTTPARVDELQIADPAPGSTTTPQTDPFNFFTLEVIDAIEEPPGTATTQVFLDCPGNTTEEYTREEALALTPDTMPCDVSGVRVLFDGRIDAGGAGVLSLDLRLRPEQRDGSAPITAADSPIANTAQGIVADVAPIGDCPPPEGARYACDQGTAPIELAAPTFAITADKSISPATQTEGDDGPVTVTISAQNSGSARPYLDTLTDDDPTFWNAVDFIGIDPDWTLPEPVEFVQACYLSGGDFSADNVEADTVGGEWTCQDLPPGPPFEEGDLSAGEAAAFVNDAATTEDIHGLRFTFMAGNEIGWQNPPDPVIAVPFQVERREDLRTGGPVPTTRADQTPSPGETEAGIFVNTVEASGQSVLVGADERLTAEDTADAAYTHDHLDIGVDVEKGPSGDVQPGQIIPFTLTYTNTGEAPLTDPVFTDVLPSDAAGNQLIFDPDSDPAITSPYDFELTGDAPDPPSGAALPTEQDEITITEDGDTITFEMPAGSVLEVGQSYTITIDLMLRPGLSPGDELTNTALIVADEPFDPGNCAPDFDAQTGACSDATTVSPIAVAALATAKGVRADVPVEESGIPPVHLDRSVIPEGATVPDDYCATAADGEGFYRAPCVPVTYPGDTETWKFDITNVGTLPMDTVVAMDSLPAVGDTGILVPLPRSSQWDPTFVDDVTLQTESAGAEMTVFYSTSPTPCTDDLDPLAPPCPDGQWLPYDSATTDPADVTSLKFHVAFTDADPFDAGEQMTLSFTTRTTPTDLTEDDFPVAWNTVATGGTSTVDGTRSTVVATEGRKVGVTYPTGAIQLEKLVSGEGAQYAPDEFIVQPICTTDPDATAVAGLDPVTLTPGADPERIDGLPWGAECTATETAQGQTEQIIGTATVGGPEDPIGLVSVENVFQLGDLSVSKTVDSDAVDQDGSPLDYGPFEVSVTCSFLGEEVVGGGYDDSPMMFAIDDGETVTLTDLPVGAECVTTETDAADAAEVTITPETVEITDTTATNPPVEVEITNTYAVGALHLRKFVPERVQDFPISRGPFTLAVECVLTDASRPEGEVVFADDTIVLPDDDNVPNDVMDYSIDDLPAGAVCTVTEPDAGAATLHVITPQQVEIDADDTAEVVVTNLFGAGALTVTKTVDGPGAERYGVGPFEVAVTCTYTDVNGQPQPLGTPGGATRQLSEDNGYTAIYDPLLLGSTCRIEETGTGGATETVVTDASGTPISEFTVDSLTEDIRIDVRNTFEVGRLRVNKSVTGPGSGPFEVRLTCTREVDGDDIGIDVPGGADRTLSEAGGFTTVYDELPVGAECSLVETDDGGADRTTITPNAGDPEVGAVTIEDDAEATIDVENEFAETGAGSGDGGGGLLPGTGAGSGLLALLLLGLTLLGGKALLVRRDRRQIQD